MGWIPPDNLYKTYSLTEQMMIGPQGELKLLEKFLIHHDIEINEFTLESLGNLNSSIHEILLNSEYNDEKESYSDISDKILFIGSSIPLDILFSKDIVSFILGGISTVLISKNIDFSKISQINAKELLKILKEWLKDKYSNSENEKSVIIRNTTEKILESPDGLKIIEKTSNIVEFKQNSKNKK